MAIVTASLKASKILLLPVTQYKTDKLLGALKVKSKPLLLLALVLAVSFSPFGFIFLQIFLKSSAFIPSPDFRPKDSHALPPHKPITFLLASFP